MAWQLFAIVQMFVIALGVGVALWLRIRAVGAQNDALREHLAALEAVEPVEPQPSPEEWVASRLEALDQEAPATTVITAVLHNALKPKRSFAGKLPGIIQEAGLGGGGEDSGETETLKARVAELEQALAEAPAAATDGEQPEELKLLLQQFTRDSREMMACIQKLEKENQALREQLGITDTEDAA